MIAPSTPERSQFSSALLGVAATAAVGCLLAGGLAGWRTALSVGVGGIAALANLWLLGLLVSRWLGSEGKAGPWALLALLKFGALVALLSGLVAWKVARPIPLILGFGALPIGIVLGQLVAARPVREEKS
jgi:hypothetical protein